MCAATGGSIPGRHGAAADPAQRLDGAAHRVQGLLGLRAPDGAHRGTELLLQGPGHQLPEDGPAAAIQFVCYDLIKSGLAWYAAVMAARNAY